MQISQQRFLLMLTALVESAQDYAMITLSCDRCITGWSAGAATLLGWTEEEVLGRPVDFIFVPDDRAAGMPEREAAQALQEGRANDERWHVRKDGSRFWANGWMLPFHGDGVSGLLKIMRDDTDKRLAEQATLDSERRFRTLTEHIPQLVWRSHPSGERSWFSSQWMAFTGLSEEKSLGLGWLSAVHPDDIDRTMQMWQEATRTGQLYIEHRLRRQADGEYRWFQTRATRHVDDEGNIHEWFGTSTDVHELRRLQERQQVLLRELHHRSRNLLAIVSAIASRTLTLSHSLKEFGNHFQHRISALARVQGLITRDDRPVLDLAEIVHSEIAALGDDWKNRVVLEGPSVYLRERAAETLGLALHELATNAVKFGALSSPTGKLEVTWRRCEDGWLTLQWLETGIEQRDRPRQRGYGMELIEIALPHALGAKTRYEIEPGKVKCIISLPDYELHKQSLRGTDRQNLNTLGRDLTLQNRVR